eukprot:CAMPEP_0185002044 /NCGR_PEP_ID=MMETSP1098-20130426/72756_1 /TAXON_ID=89044 /ORGANISM="Spumella elongata, Strain CCAP 955/1" /LENGTH=440 /DNA_ID=CAMNT_0027529461 /DNA_START=240 /DNA_END=1562 /DNA_ORIENTATION=-
MPDQNLTRNTTTVYLFDPSHDAGEPPQVDCFVVIAASPNVKHFSDFIKGGSAKLFKINRFSLEEVISFYATLYPPTEPHSGTAPVGDEDTFATRLGPIRSAEDNLPLCENHLRYGFYEVGGSVRALQSWHTLLAAIDVRNEAIARIENFKVFNLANLSLLIASGRQETVDHYTSKLCSYRNNADPNNYLTYHYKFNVEINSWGTLVAICRTHYKAMYEHMTSLLEQNRADEAGFYFELLGRTALTMCTVMVARDLRFVGNPLVLVRRHQYLRRLRLPLGRIAPPSVNLLADVLELPLAAPADLEPFPANTTTRTAGKRALDDCIPVLAHEPPVPTERDLLSTEGNIPVKAFDKRNRGFQFTVDKTRNMEFTPMETLLNGLGCSAEQPLHLFLAVPQEIFDSWVHTQSLVKTTGPPLTPENRAFINNRVHQYVIRIPKDVA